MTNRSMFRFFWLVFLSFLAACSPGGCSQDDIPPEEQLHSYIDLLVNITHPEQRQDLIDLTSDPLSSNILSLSEKEFREAFLDSRYDFKTFEIQERRDISEKLIEIDFKMAFKRWQAGQNKDNAPDVILVNRAFLKYELGRWALSDVTSLDTEYDWSIGIPVEEADKYAPKLGSDESDEGNEEGNEEGDGGE